MLRNPPRSGLLFLPVVIGWGEDPTGREALQAQGKSNLVVIREDLANDILRAGCDGMIFQEMDDYGREWGKLRE
ncbi:hypothetical protein MXAN_0427 [Myxococcus xanthus DK 1622]|uniref:Uncharacterized protein n=1 Tax=Myxococcus xanthus (strain DK1622) TaxID=246197 RepID=Q1DF76_MYXXD|nr:hypothetical protein MXAN_0427 [Myxococcus xanthus DK 1622]